MAVWGDLTPLRPLERVIGTRELPTTVSDLRDDGPLVFRAKFPLPMALASPLFFALGWFLIQVKWPGMHLALKVTLSSILPTVIVARYVVCLFWRIELTEDGVTLRSYVNEIRCPWSLFATVGSVHYDERWQRVLFPVNPTAIARVERRAGHRVDVTGARARTWQARFPDGKRGLISGYYGVDMVELMQFIVGLTTMDDADADPSEPIELVSKSGRWRELDLARYVAPMQCCGCGSTEHVDPVEFRAAALGSLQGVEHADESLYLPVCRPCTRRYWMSRMVIRLVMLTWIGVGIYAAIVLQSGAVYALAGVIVGVALVPFVAWRHAPFAPARVKRVSLARGTAQIWVRDSDFYDALAAEVDTRVDA